MENLIPLTDDICLIFRYPSDEIYSRFDIKESLSALEAEYINLFVNNLDEPIISLYASTYLKPLNTENVLEKLNKIILSSDLQLSDSERIDHITIIFEFFGILIESNIDYEFIKLFLSSYILCFEPLINNIRNRTKNKLYLLGADKLESFFNKVKKYE